MNIRELYQKLTEAYAAENLNRISLTLINLFKNKEYSVLQKISEIISDFVVINITDEGKGFSKFMMLYHPDRAGFHLKEISRLTEQNNFDALLNYSHILKLERVDEIASSLETLEDIDYAPVYEWDLSTDGFSIVDERRAGSYERIKTNTGLIGYTLYNALKLREYGDTSIEYPFYYLEDIEDLELSSSDIVDLDGIQYCTNARTIDLSDNRINDISLLVWINGLEELNLSDNQIELIDAISSLKNLRSLWLSNNQIRDLSPLYELEKLDYVDLNGNDIDSDQVRMLIDMGVNIEFDE